MNWFLCLQLTRASPRPGIRTVRSTRPNRANHPGLSHTGRCKQSLRLVSVSCPSARVIYPPKIARGVLLSWSAWGPLRRDVTRRAEVRMGGQAERAGGEGGRVRLSRNVKECRCVLWGA